MIPAKQLLNEIASSLRNVIAPAINEPFPKAQAYMAAVLLEFISGQVEERGDLVERKDAALASLFHDLAGMPAVNRLAGQTDEAGLCQLVERLYTERERLGEELFTAANHRVRQALRQLLDQDLAIAKAKE